MTEECITCGEELCESLGEVVMTRAATGPSWSCAGEPPEYDWMCYDCMNEEEEYDYEAEFGIEEDILDGW